MVSGLATAATLMFALLAPGWAIITGAGLGKEWRPILRWFLAALLGIAFYPVLFYAARFLFPGFRFGRVELALLLLLCTALVAWRWRRGWRDSFRFDRLDLLALAIVGATLFTRYWIVRDQPYPAWSDSLHHTLLTQLTATRGQLPYQLEPFSPTPLDMYHLGLYTLSAAPQILLGVPSHTALLFTAQTLNGLCGLGLFLLLDAKVGRVAGLIGLLTVGLLSHQPAFYVNWGRFTQLASQCLLVGAFFVTIEALRRWQQPALDRREMAGWVIAAALLNAGVFLLHFRAAAFYGALLAPGIAWEAFKATRHARLARFVAALALVGALSLLMAAPALVQALATYLDRAPREVAAATASGSAEIYRAISWDAVPDLVARPWLLVIAAVAAVFALLRRNQWAVLTLIWCMLLLAIGNASRLGVPALEVTNLSGVLIAFYLPISLLVGIGAEELVRAWPEKHRQAAVTGLLAAALVAGFVMTHVRVADVEVYRYFMTADDEQAMQWIRDNTAPDALFAINTYFWLPDSPHGTDGGYWIPYATGRRTTASNMMFSLSPPEYRAEVVRLSRAADQLDLPALRAAGVRYVYSGARGDFAGVGLRRDVLETVGNELVLVHEAGAATVWEIRNAGG